MLFIECACYFACAQGIGLGGRLTHSHFELKLGYLRHLRYPCCWRLCHDSIIFFLVIACSSCVCWHCAEPCARPKLAEVLHLVKRFLIWPEIFLIRCIVSYFTVLPSPQPFVFSLGCGTKKFIQLLGGRLARNLLKICSKNFNFLGSEDFAACLLHIIMSGWASSVNLPQDAVCGSHKG